MDKQQKVDQHMEALDKDLSEHDYRLRTEKRSLAGALMTNPLAAVGIVASITACAYGAKTLMSNQTGNTKDFNFAHSLGQRARFQYVTLLLFVGGVGVSSLYNNIKTKYEESHRQ